MVGALISIWSVAHGRWSVVGGWSVVLYYAPHSVGCDLVRSEILQVLTVFLFWHTLPSRPLPKTRSLMLQKRKREPAYNQLVCETELGLETR